MANLILPNTIEALSTADAVEVEQNYQSLTSFVNNSVIHRDGAFAMTGQLTLVNTAPIDDRHAAPKGYVDSFIPIGVIMPYGGAAAPAGSKWALCDGAAKSTTAFPELFAVLQYRYGGTGGTFNLPNLVGRVTVGVDAGQTRFNLTGKAGGSWLVPIPSHTHGIDHNHGSLTSGGQSVTHTHEIPTHYHTMSHNHPSKTVSGTTGAAGAHDHDGKYYGVASTNPSGYQIVVPQSNATFSGSKAATDTAAAHSHSFSATVDIDNYVGNTTGIIASGTGSERTTGNASVGHTHAVDLPAFTGTSAATSLEVQIDNNPVTKSTTEHIPPYVVVNYIIRVQ